MLWSNFATSAHRSEEIPDVRVVERGDRVPAIIHRGKGIVSFAMASGHNFADEPLGIPPLYHRQKRDEIVVYVRTKELENLEGR